MNTDLHHKKQLYLYHDHAKTRIILTRLVTILCTKLKYLVHFLFIQILYIIYVYNYIKLNLDVIFYCNHTKNKIYISYGKFIRLKIKFTS